MTQAAGFYNTLLQGDDPALLIECLNGYRRKEPMPSNISTFTVPLGKPEVIRTGTDVTIVTYGAMCHIVLEAATMLAKWGIDCEVIDVQTLLPFDCAHLIVASLQKTHRLVLADEAYKACRSALTNLTQAKGAPLQRTVSKASRTGGALLNGRGR